jgi:hypothetical protein
MNKRKVLSGLYGLSVVAAGIWLDSHGMKLGSQIVVITAFALLGPVSVAVVTKGLWKAWFFVALVSCALFHAVLLWSLHSSMPLSTLGVAILFGVLESLGLAVASAKVSKVYRQGAK